MEDFTEWIEVQLRERNWNTAELAKRAKINSGTLSNVLNRTRRPGPEVCLAIARALNYSPEIVFRQAGLLPPAPQPDLEIEEVAHLFQQLSPEQRKLALSTLRAWVEGR
ncbi:MAG: hypothetical protein DPW09_22050 [Anaerolineae bacterium]|nr:helix-turn-helix transcriptional regulator [Anaerolineales bacterium]MCQ3976120.1 hypothetical protein [Anaerolineae bacterium]